MGSNLSALLPYAATGGLGFLATWFLFGVTRPVRRPSKTPVSESSGPSQKKVLACLGHSVLRKAMLANHGPTDHSGSVVIVPAPNFDLNATIFQTLEGTLPRAVIGSKIGVDMYWEDHAIERVSAAVKGIPTMLSHDKALLEFMVDDCHFFMEHADGSFMDHLQFVHDYSAHYFKGQSPRVMLLHSIMGVATNIFPMAVEKEPRLRAMLTDDEMLHVEAFPSVLRCLLNWDLTEELASIDDAKLRGLKTFTYHRCIDNKKASMSIEAFWVHLNYQLIHLLDFLPAASWKSHMNDQLFLVFIKLHAFLVRHGKLMATVDLDMSEAVSSSAGMPMTLVGMINKMLPASLSKKLHLKSIRKFSSNIGHCLDYSLVTSVA